MTAVTVIVPTHGRPGDLLRLLALLGGLTPPPGGFEVVVVDDGSPEPVEPLVRAAAAAVPQLRVVRRPNGGPAAARNTGAAAARGALLAFTDDDCLPVPGWLVALAGAADAHPGALLGGPTACALPGNPWADASQALEDAVYGRANADPARARFFASKNLAVPAGAFAAAGGFDERFRNAEDRELCARWLEQGRPMALAPGALVRHANPASARRFVSQHLGYGRGAFHFHRARRSAGGEGLRIAPADYLAFAREPLRGPRRGTPRPVVLGLVAASQAASAAGYAHEALRSRRHAGLTGDGATARAAAGGVRT